ncbi:MAG: hypothetical protein ABSD31_07250 [Candidatus Binataceae bacterium]|jgi:hypothetical protein
MAASKSLHREIVQILPADGWGAEFRYNHGKTISTITLPLICWSLVADEQMGRRLVGLIAGENGHVAFADLEKGFNKYERLT